MASERRQVKVTRNGNSNDRRSNETKTLINKIYKGRFQYLSLLVKEIKFESRDISLSYSHISIGDARRTLLLIPWVEYVKLFAHFPGSRAKTYFNINPDTTGLTPIYI